MDVIATLRSLAKSLLESILGRIPVFPAMFRRRGVALVSFSLAAILLKEDGSLFFLKLFFSHTCLDYTWHPRHQTYDRD